MESKRTIDENEEILKELCMVNGLNPSKVDFEGPHIVELELFFCNFPRIVGLQYFTNLQVLCIIGNQLQTLPDLSYCATLVELWVCECQLEVISGLKGLSCLRKLCLFDNSITKMQGLNHLEKLEFLWLNNNKIWRIEDLTNMKNLQDLNLALNDISSIGTSLAGNTVLQTLDLSGNKISSFKDAMNLQCLPALRTLFLHNPLYSSCPLAQLCNYSTQMIFLLPQLQNLDTMDVSLKAVKDGAELVVQRKKLFYTMQAKCIWRNYRELEGILRQLNDTLSSECCIRIHRLALTIKELEQFAEESHAELLSPATGGIQTSQSPGRDKTRTSGRSDASPDQNNTPSKREELNTKLQQCEKKIGELRARTNQHLEKMNENTTYFRHSFQRLRSVTQARIAQLRTELETGGNVRFEEGSKADSIWFTPCQDLLLARFCAVDYLSYNVVGIRIHKVTRVHNRYLHQRFQDAIDQRQDKSDNSSTSQPKSFEPMRKFIEYLFWVWDPDVPTCFNNFTDSRIHWAQSTDATTGLLEHGLTDLTAHREGSKPPVHLANSLYLAEKHRMDSEIKKNLNQSYTDECPYRHGQVVLCKAFLGRACKYAVKRQTEADAYPNFDSVFKPVREDVTDVFPFTCAVDTLNDEDQPSTSNTNNANTANTAPPPQSKTIEASKAAPTPSHASTCVCCRHQSEWFVFNEAFVVPEYIIDFEYITKAPPKVFFFSEEEQAKVVQQRYKPSQGLDISQPLDTDVLELPPYVKPRLRTTQLSEESICQMVHAESITNITCLNLINCGLVKVKVLQKLPSLQQLSLAFNDLQRLDDLAHMKLEVLDVSYNRVNSLEGFKSMTHLSSLDLSWNKLKNTREDVSILRKHCPAISVLDLRHNCWQKAEGLRLRAIGRIKTLKMFNGDKVTEEEMATGMQMALNSRISQLAILEYSRIDAEVPRVFTMLPAALSLNSHSKQTPAGLVDSNPNWFKLVTSLALDRLHISKISNLDKFESLKYASFNDNDITKIEGLDHCVSLEELSLEDNCITKIDNIKHLVKLRWLNLSNNYIHSLENSGIDHLTQLEYLEMEGNNLNSLLGLQRNTKLVELYLANNRIINIREIFYIKQTLTNLFILDLFGNPLAYRYDDFRTFVIYHLKSLKALNGNAVEQSEVLQARDMYGGRLTEDYIVEKFGHANFNVIVELNFPNANIRLVDLGKAEAFKNLKSVNLENNNLTSFSGLVYLTNLRVLCLNNNRIESIVPKPKTQSKNQNQKSVYNQPFNAMSNPEFFTPLLEQLEVLHLGYNGIKDMTLLQLGRLPSLRALFLQGNDIASVEGLDGLTDLRELVLDRNKIRGFSELSFATQYNLTELHIEENRVRDLSHLKCLGHLQRLYLGMNKIQEMSELEKLEPMQNLLEISLASNIVAKRSQHRHTLIVHIPALRVIDGIPVTDDERLKAQIWFAEQQLSSSAPPVTYEPPSATTYARATNQVAVKVTNMTLMNTNSPFPIIDGQLAQKGGGRRGPRNLEPLFPGSSNKSSYTTYSDNKNNNPDSRRHAPRR